MLLDLFLCFFQVGLFSIGGGYAAMPMIQSKAVEYYHWLNMSEFTDLMTIGGDDAGSDHGQLRDLCRHPHGGNPGCARRDDRLHFPVGSSSFR